MSEVGLQDRPEGFRRVAAVLAERQHPHAPVFLEVAARTAQEAADAEFVKARTGFTIGGVSTVGQTTKPVLLIDRELFRSDEVWAAAGHPNGVFRLSPQELEQLTGAPVEDVVQA